MGAKTSGRHSMMERTIEAGRQPDDHDTVDGADEQHQRHADRYLNEGEPQKSGAHNGRSGVAASAKGRKRGPRLIQVFNRVWLTRFTYHPIRSEPHSTRPLR